MHNPQEAAAEFRYSLEGTRAVRPVRIGFRMVRRSDRSLDSGKRNLPHDNRFFGVLAQFDHAGPLY
jgi:hypothetical protein